MQTAKTVLQQGAPALIEAVEAGRVSVSTAAALSQAPKEEQAELVARGKKEILQAAKAIRQAEGEKRRRERTEHLAKLSASSAKDLGSLGLFPVLYADPPWRYTQHSDSTRSVENHYPTMEVEEICALGVDQLATEDAVLFLWATAPLLPEALRVLASWGFDYKTSWVWDKEHPGMGNWGRIQHELILIATRGRHPTPAPEARPPSVFRAPRTEHSKKPPQVRAAIEGMFPSLPRVELFARGEAPPGWVFWGNQAAS